MSIGYACIQIGSEETKLSSLRLNNASAENLRKVISKNLNALEAIIKYNIENEIKLFRISSDIIPFGSHPANKIPWWEEFQDQLQVIGELIKKSGLRVSMHPGQYTVLNSTRTDVVSKAVDELEYHAKFLDSLGCSDSCKMILHIGGIYSDKKAATDRFIDNYNKLNSRVKSRLVIENDDKSYHIQDVLYISERTGIPVVFDNLHNEINKAENEYSEYDWIDKCNKTWKAKDGKQKTHYSQSKINGTKGAHSDYINSTQFMDFYDGLHSKDIDIMLEVKDKNLSAVKCILLTKENIKIGNLEKEWTKFKYLVLSRSASNYNSIRNLLKDKDKPDARLFYKYIEETLDLSEDVGAEINAAQHIWSYVSKKASKNEKARFERLISQYSEGKTSENSIKNFLFKLAKEQSAEYLLGSLYFYIRHKK